MTAHVMLATDFSPSSMLAADAAHDLAKAFDARVTLLHVTKPGSNPDDALAALAELKDGRFANLPRVELLTVEGARAAKAVCDAARDGHVDLIVAGRQGKHALSEQLIGTTTERIARHAACNIFVAHPARREARAPRHFLVGTDFSEQALVAVRAAASWARQLDGWVSLVHVYDLFPPMEVLEEPYEGHEDRSFRGMLADKLENLRKKELDGVPSDSVVLRDKSTVRALCDFADDKQVDAIVLGTHGLTGMQRLLLGNVAERVMRHAGCAVAVVRPSLA